MKRLIIAAYLIASLLYSAVFSACGDWSIARHRAPFLLVEVVQSTVTEEGPGYAEGIQSNGNPIWYAPDDVHPGDHVWHVMVYNPLSNASDDLIARYDF